MTTTTTTMIATSAGLMATPVHVSAGGLAVAQNPAGYWTVTHIASGLAIGLQQWRMPEPAQRAMHAALASPIDWTQDLDALKATDQAVIKRLLWRMRRAAVPPRRVCSAARHRRLKPYAAESKRAAIRAARPLDALTFADLYTYHWTNWGDMAIRPIRQPCRRFVARRAAERGVARRTAQRAARRAQLEATNG